MPAYRNKTGINRGKHFHRKGWREPSSGSLYFQLKREKHSRYHAVSPNTTMEQLIDSLLSDVQDEYGELEDGLEFAFFFHKKLLERSSEPAFDTSDGGETVYAKVVDEDGLEYSKPWFGGTWTVKVRGRKPKA